MTWWRSQRRLAVLLVMGTLGLTCGREPAVEADSTGSDSEYAQALPAGAVFVASGHDLRGFWTRLQATQLYTQLAAIEGVRESFAPIAEMQAEFLSETGLELNEETIMAVFGGRFDLGYYGRVGEDRSDVLMVAEIADEATVVTILDAVEAQIAEEKNIVFSDTEYEGIAVRVGIDGDGEKSVYRALDDGVLTISSTLGRLEMALDMRAGRGAHESMGATAAYVEVIDKLPAVDLSVYIDPRAIQEATVRAAEEGAVDSAERERVEAASEVFSGYDYLRGFAFGLSWTEDGLMIDQYALLEAGPRTGFARVLSAVAAPARTLDLQPASTLAYMALNTIDVDATYEELRRFAVDATRVQLEVQGTADSLRGDQEVEAAIERFERQSGLDIEEDIVAWLGDEIAFSVTGIDRSGFVPLPQIAIVATTRDADRAREAFSKLEALLTDLARDRASIPLSWQSEEAAGTTIRSTSAQFVQLAYAITDEEVVVTTGTAVLRSMLDARSEGVERLVTSPGFQSMSGFYPDAVNGIGYIDLAATLTEVEGLLQSFGSMAGPSAADSTSTGRRVLSALKNAPRVGFYGAADDDGYAGRLLVEVQ